MILTPVSHIIFYGYIGFVVLFALYLSRSRGKSVQKYFFGESSNNSIVISFSLFLIFLINALIIVLPFLSINSFSQSSIIILAAILISVIIGKASIGIAKSLFESSGNFVKSLLSIHGLIFICFAQIVVYVHISDFMLSQFFSGSHFGMQVLMIAAAGVYGIIGGLNAVLYANVVTGAFVIGSTLFVALNAVLFQDQTLFSFQSILRAGTGVFQSHGAIETNIIVAGVGMLLMMLWIMWFEMGMMHKLTAAKTEHIRFRSMFFGGGMAVVIAVFTLFSLRDVSQQVIVFSQTSTFFNTIIAISLLGGVIGLFALSFQSAATIIAIHIPPIFKFNYIEEEQVLFGRLSTVVIALLAILMIPVAKIVDSMTLVWYINFLAFFSTPIVGTLLSSMIMKKGNGAGFTAGLLAGEIYAVVEYFAQEFSFPLTLLNSTSVYTNAIGIAFVSAVMNIVVSKVSEMHMVQRLRARMRPSRSI